jgi:hypothetical protein
LKREEENECYVETINGSIYEKDVLKEAIKEIVNCNML